MGGYNDDDYPRLEQRFIVSLYIISVALIILCTTLTFADKRTFDAFNIIDLTFESLQIIILTINFCFLSSNDLLAVINGILFLFNTVFSFFAYWNSEKFDFLGICIFIRIIKIFTIPPLLLNIYDGYL